MMKKYSTVVLFSLISLFLFTSCSLPFGLFKPAPFEKGILEDSTYINKQANLKIIVPEGWEAKINEDAQDSMEDAVDGADIKKDNMSFSDIDFSCMNPDTGSNFSVAYSLRPDNINFMTLIDKTMKDLVKQATDAGLTLKQTDSFEKVIAGHTCQVSEFEATTNGMTITEYLCFFEVDAYIGMIVIVPNDFIDENESFDNLLGYFSAVN